VKTFWRKYKSVLQVALVIIAVACVYGYEEFNRGLPNLHFVKPAFNVQASDLISQFENDEHHASAQYSDKAISVRGVIGAIQATDTSATVFLNDGRSMTSVICQFDKKNRNEASRFRKNDLVTIKGVCSGFLMDVVMVRCVVDK
jgi:hypothetical protein